MKYDELNKGGTLLQSSPHKILFCRVKNKMFVEIAEYEFMKVLSFGEFLTTDKDKSHSWILTRSNYLTKSDIEFLVERLGQ